MAEPKVESVQSALLPLRYGAKGEKAYYKGAANAETPQNNSQSPSRTPTQSPNKSHSKSPLQLSKQKAQKLSYRVLAASTIAIPPKRSFSPKRPSKQDYLDSRKKTILDQVYQSKPEKQLEPMDSYLDISERQVEQKKSTSFSRSLISKRITQDIIKDYIETTLENIKRPPAVQEEECSRIKMPKVLLGSRIKPAKQSTSSHGVIKAYSASTEKGIGRKANEDRVSIAVDIARPEHSNSWKPASYFAVFDGHSGAGCANFLKENLHQFISKEKNFPYNIELSILSGFAKCDRLFTDISYQSSDRSGASAVVAFFFAEQCFVCWVGDSRAILCSKRGNIIRQLSRDHSVDNPKEQQNVLKNGGRILQVTLRSSDPAKKIFYEEEFHASVTGPHRVLPGWLSVTRCFGEIESKLKEFGGNPDALKCTPELIQFRVDHTHDFIVLGSDGIFDKLTNAEVVATVWDALIRERDKFLNIHEFCARAAENVIRYAQQKKSIDNATVVVIALEGLERQFNYFMANKSEFDKQKKKLHERITSRKQQKSAILEKGDRQKLISRSKSKRATH